MNDHTDTNTNTFAITEDELRLLLIYLSSAKTLYELVGRITGDGEERFAIHRLSIEQLSWKIRGALEQAQRSRALVPVRPPEDNPTT